ncbi:hypothetical protein OG709_30125 [Streptomyces sp. NBC_01267]|uniref:hypothetical protein n=1 Tax=Streptomyces sp. NBC_01267 TaxID=2903805 RepID=UPI002E375032|nr:hypothetical protein [Streptomyces sp. NBC_01267]
MAVRLTPAQFKALDGATDAGHVEAHGLTIRVLNELGLIEAVRGWVEVSASSYHRRARATERTWGTTGYRITDSGRRQLELAKLRNSRK